ncbi:MAG TPA: sulfurtransferase [Solirubrobacteraceae bacterium]|nr:sulfurtransferase [Solirubrobacteraceae bacterium]
MAGPLVSVEWLRERLGEPGLVVADCRYRLGEPGAGELLWRESHIPGAAFIDVDRDLAAPPGERGRHPLPEPADFEAVARRAGIGPGTAVIAYDEAAEGGAARLWWLLRHFGHTGAAVLDGGLRAWREAGGPMRGGQEEIEPGTFHAREAITGDTASVEELAATDPPLLLDARAPERYRGETEPIDSVAGHIPGAHNLPFVEAAPDGQFLPPAELRARLKAAGVGPDAHFVAYCGSGVTACILVLAAEVAGLEGARLYPGSWSEWSRRGLPAEGGGPSAARH